MPKGYTSNQTGAIASLLAINIILMVNYIIFRQKADIGVMKQIWVYTELELNIGYITKILDFTQAVFVILIILGWILLFFYIKLKRPVFIIGMFFSLICLILYAIESCVYSSVADYLWYGDFIGCFLLNFTEPLNQFFNAFHYVFFILGIYFAYRSYKELKIGTRIASNFTSNQTGAIACLLGVLTWATWPIIITGSGSLKYMIWASYGFYIRIALDYIIHAELFFRAIVPIGWIILFLYIRRKKFALIIGMYLLVMIMIALLIFPRLTGTTAWYAFERGLFDFTYIVIYLTGFASIFFSYKSHKELK